MLARLWWSACGAVAPSPFGGGLGWGQVQKHCRDRACPHPNLPPVGEGAGGPMTQKLKLAGVVGHVVCNLDLAADDVGLYGFDFFLHVRRHELFVVGIHRKADTAFFQAQH